MIGPWWRAAAWLALALLSLAAPARATTTIHADGLETMADTGWLPFTGIKSFSSNYGTPSNWATPGDGNYTELVPATTYAELIEGGQRYMGPLASGYGPYYLEFEWPDLTSLPDTTQFVRGYEFRIDILVQAYAANGILLPPERGSLVISSAYVAFDAFGQGSGEKADFIDLPAGLPPGTTFGSHFIGGPADLWNGATPAELLAQTTAEKHLPATWKQWSSSHKVRLQLTNTGDTLLRAWVDFAACRFTYVPIAQQYARSVGTGTLAAAITRARLLKPATVTGTGTVTAGLKSGTNLASRIYSGPARGRGTLDVVLTKSVGGVRSTYLYPEPKA
ncbi:MAG: hypothetical protein KAX77_05060, partial [Xanthomonadales bacterium]|nr:hypothetical protein [Xanthomonadales bacterium]